MTALGAEHDRDRVAGLAAETQRRFGRFVREWVDPGAEARDRTGEPLPRAVLEEAGRAGLTGFSLPPEVGGQGRDKFEWGIVLEEVARLSRDPGLLSLIDVGAGVVELLVATGRRDLVERYAIPIAAGTYVCPPAAYEGRDPFEYATIAREEAGGWRLDGGKPFIGGALLADAFLVYARDEASGDILSFLVERGDAGVCVDRLATPGLRSMGFGSLSLAGVRLPGERVVADADALSAMNAYLRNRRLMTACAAVGHLRGLLDACILALAGRRRGGRGVLELPNVQRTVGEMYAAVHTSRAIVHRALATTSGPRDGFFDPMATVAKEFVAEQAIRVGRAVMDLQGGEGYMSRQPWERYVRDALGLIGGQGAQELLLIQLGQHAALEVEQRQVRMERAQHTIADLSMGWWAYTTLASALETGLLDELLTPATAAEAAGRVGSAPALVEEMLHVLAATGLVRRLGERFALSDGLEAILTTGPRRAALASDARSAGPLRDPEPVDARVEAAAALGGFVAVELARQLDGLDERLNRPDARLLCAGEGAARLAVELCRRLPAAHVVAADPQDGRPLAGGPDELDAGGFDVAWIAAEGPGLEAALRSLRPGGWALVRTSSAPGADLRGAVSRLRSVRREGHARLPDELARALEAAGYGAVRLVPDPLGGTFAAGRRTR